MCTVKTLLEAYIIFIYYAFEYVGQGFQYIKYYTKY